MKTKKRLERERENVVVCWETTRPKRQSADNKSWTTEAKAPD